MVKTKITRRVTKRKPLTLTYVRTALSYNRRTGQFRWKYRADVPVYINTREKGQIAGNLSPYNGYRRIGIRGHTVLAHRLAWFYVTGKWPQKLDHKNTDRDDNRFKNLRPATRSQNACNSRRRKTNRSGFKGVQYRPQRHYKHPYIARISFNGVQYYLGCFYTAGEAHAAYKKAAKRLHGKFARHA